MRAYQHALGKVLEGATAMQSIDKQRNLDAFLAVQQRLKARKGEAQTARDCRATAELLADDIGRHFTGEGDHV